MQISMVDACTDVRSIGGLSIGIQSDVIHEDSHVEEGECRRPPALQQRRRSTLSQRYPGMLSPLSTDVLATAWEHGHQIERTHVEAQHRARPRKSAPS